MFGMCCAPEMFKKILEQMLLGCDGCFNYIDDIIVVGATREEHDSNLSKVMATLNENGVLLNVEKCILRQSEIEFLGHKLSAAGIQPSDDKVDYSNNC